MLSFPHLSSWLPPLSLILSVTLTSVERRIPGILDFADLNKGIQAITSPKWSISLVKHFVFDTLAVDDIDPFSQRGLQVYNAKIQKKDLDSQARRLRLPRRRRRGRGLDWILCAPRRAPLFLVQRSCGPPPRVSKSRILADARGRKLGPVIWVQISVRKRMAQSVVSIGSWLLHACISWTAKYVSVKTNAVLSWCFMW